MKSTRIFATLFLASALCWASASAQARERYTLHSRKIPGSDDDYVWLRDNRKQRVLWKRRMRTFDSDGLHWSKDRRALAIEGVTSDTWGVLVWREGYRLRNFGVPDDADYSMGIVWSPDNRRLLMRTGASAATDADVGPLLCLRLERWPNYHYDGVGLARKMAWKKRKTVIYWTVDHEYKTIQKPIFWRAP